MKKITTHFFVVLLMFISSAGLLAQPNVLPNVQSWNNGKGYFKLANSSRIVCSEDDYTTLKKDLEQFSADLAEVSGKNLTVVKGTARKGDLLFTLNANNKEIGNEGYIMQVNSKITVSANKAHGAFYGMQTLLQLFKQSAKLKKGKAVDYPKVAERGFMIDCGRKYFEIEYIENLIRRLAWMKVNFIHLHFTEWNGFRLKSELFPGLASDQAYSKEDIRRIQDFAAKYYVMVVPEIDVPAHSTAITDYNPYLGFKCKSMRYAKKWQGDEANEQDKAWALDATRPEVRSWLRALLDEWIPLFDGPYFHIGGDEWQYDREKLQCPEFVKAAAEKGYEYPGDLYVEWINEMNDQVKSYGKTTQIWNWWNFSPSEEQQNKTSIHPDKDIVINVWNHPRQKEIINAGYKTILTSEEGEEALYVTPFDGTGDKKPGDYGVFHSQRIYEEWEPNTHKNVNGFKVCLWANEAEDKADEWFNQYYDLPLAVFAEKTWGSKEEASIEAFEEKFETIGKSLKK
ncbi:hypothetical protein E9993_15265 [Labilibacter sediminis]|nr:hypothetical protein E9993_15265 [Labilibacter sediminis]